MVNKIWYIDKMENIGYEVLRKILLISSEEEQRAVLGAIYQKYVIEENGGEIDVSPTRGVRVRRYFSYTKGDCTKELEKVNTYQTNKDHVKFYQIWYTAGNEKEFMAVLNDSTPTFSKLDLSLIKKTFKYILQYSKKAIFVSIRNGKIVQWLPFLNANFENEFTGTPFDKINKQYKNIPQSPKTKPKKEWYANGCLLKFKNEPFESDRLYSLYYDQIMELCKKTPLTANFFINTMDFPILKKNRTHPSPQAFNCRQKTRLISDDILPILSQSTHSEYSDIAIPTSDDWKLVSKKYFLSSDGCDEPADLSFLDSLPQWDRRKNELLFRGSATGCGIGEDTNMRIKAATMALKNKDWNIKLVLGNYAKPRIIDGRLVNQDYRKMDRIKIPTRDKMTRAEQVTYKYILHIDGHVSAFRLSTEMFMGSCILKVDSDFSLWFSDKIKPYVHYVPVNHDLSNLNDIWNWCKDNPDVTRQIAQNAREFAVGHFTKDSMTYALRDILQNIQE